MFQWPEVFRRLFLACLKLRILARYISRVWIFIALFIPAILVVSIVWRHFGNETCLPILADTTPILLAIVGIVMSYLPPKKETHWVMTIVLFLAGGVGTVIISINRSAGDTAHRSEVKALNEKIGTVQNQNTAILTTLTNGSLAGQRISEAERRQNVEKVLRNEYILSHDPIDPNIVAGTKMPPESWINERLRQLGEKWTVRDAGLDPSISNEVVKLRDEIVWRDITNKQRDSIATQLRTFKGQKYHIKWIESDPESKHFAAQIKLALGASGWEWVPNLSADPNKSGDDDSFLESYGLPLLSGVRLWVRKSDSNSPILQALVSVLESSEIGIKGVVAKTVPDNDQELYDAQILINVGRKPRAELSQKLPR